MRFHGNPVQEPVPILMDAPEYGCLGESDMPFYSKLKKRVRQVGSYGGERAPAFAASGNQYLSSDIPVTTTALGNAPSSKCDYKIRRGS